MKTFKTYREYLDYYKKKPRRKRFPNKYYRMGWELAEEACRQMAIPELKRKYGGKG